jgi:hypothetical protein
MSEGGTLHGTICRYSASFSSPATYHRGKRE